MEKVCTSCKEPKTEFHKKSGSKDGFRSACKECTNRDNRNRARSLSPEVKLERKLRQRSLDLVRRVGITWEEKEAMLEAQNHRCAICGKQEDRPLDVDHDHKTNKVRMLLCNQCNQGLGLFMDDPFLLDKAAEYIRKFEEDV